MIKSHLAREGFIWLMLLHYSLPLKEPKAGTQVGQEPGVRNGSNVTSILSELAKHARHVGTSVESPL